MAGESTEHKKDDKWGGVSFSGIAQSLLLAAIVFVATTMYQTSGKEADTVAKIKALDDKYVELKATAASSQQLKTIEDKIADLRAGTVSHDQLKAIEDKVAELKTNEVSSVAIENFNGTQKDEITTLRSQVGADTNIAMKQETELLATANEIARLRNSDDAICEMLAKIRERLATLEATQKAAPPTK